jgi:hypothetical protein
MKRRYSNLTDPLEVISTFTSPCVIFQSHMFIFTNYDNTFYLVSAPEDGKTPKNVEENQDKGL